MLKTKKFTRTTSIITALCLCLTAFSAFNLSAQAVVESENVPDGTYYIKKQGASFFLEPGTSIASNTYDMSQRLYKGNNVQAWRLETMSSAGYVRIVNVDTGLVLGIEGNSSADLARIGLSRGRRTIPPGCTRPGTFTLWRAGNTKSSIGIPAKPSPIPVQAAASTAPASFSGPGEAPFGMNSASRTISAKWVAWGTEP